MSRIGEARSGSEADPEQIILERLRAAGVRLATRSPGRERVTVPTRPRWLAFVLRTLRMV